MIPELFNNGDKDVIWGPEIEELIDGVVPAVFTIPPVELAVV